MGTYSHSLILFKRKNIKPIRKILFPLPLFFVITFLLHYFFSFFNLHIKLEKKRNILKEKKNHRKQINLRISGSRVLGRLKKSCNCCGNPDIYAIHLLPTAYPSKKLANSREKKKKKKKIFKKPSQDLTAARRILRTHIP